MRYESIVLWTAESLPIAEKLYRSWDSSRY